MKALRKILYPFSFLYGEIVAIRNKAFDKGVLTSTKFKIPIIVVGNLNVGGTGKSPLIEYLVRLLQKKYKVAILSRGYKRKSTGFYIANKSVSAETIGDEPMQFFNKFENIIVAVDNDRVNGIEKLKKINNPPDVILLDDAFQHRKVNAGLNILLTAYNNLYVDDAMLPSGNLREKKNGAERAQIVVVTKCPKELSDKEKDKIRQKLHLKFNQSIFFSKITYHNSVLNKESQIKFNDLKKYDVLLVTGIANAKPLLNHLKLNNINFKFLKYKDHYNFKEADFVRIQLEFDKINSDKKIILTTEKDYVRSFLNKSDQIYYFPIETKFLENEIEFNQTVIDYVRKNTRNS